MGRPAGRDDSRAAAWRVLLNSGDLFPFVVLCLGIWLHAADTLLVATVMPAAVEDIGGIAYISWALSLYELASIVAACSTGLLAARLGIRSGVALAALAYAIGCVASALSPSMAVMLLGRVLQGLGGGAMVALTYVAVSQLFPERLWPRLYAIVSGVWGASAFCGPMIGGLFANAGMWRGAFAAFALQAVAVCIAAVVLLRARPAAEAAPPARIPILRLVLLSGAIVAVAAAGTTASGPRMAAFLLAGIALFAWCLRIDGRRSNALFPPRPLDPRHVSGAGLLLIFLLGITTMPFITYGPLLLATLHGTDALTAGYVVALQSIAWTLGAIAFSGAGARAEPWVIRGGALGVAIGVLGLALTVPTGPVWLLLPWVTFAGLGFGMFFGFVTRRIVSSVADERREVASSSTPTIQMIGYAFGAAASGIVANSLGFADGVTRAEAEVVGFWLFAGFLPLALFGCFAALRVAAGPGPSCAAEKA